MNFIRYLFFILILIGSTSIGFLISNKYTYRLKELNEILNLINILQNKMKFTRLPLADIFYDLSQISSYPNIAYFFKDISKNIRENSINVAISKVIQENQNMLNLKKEDYKLLIDLAMILGKTDIEGQISEIEQFKILLKSNIHKAQIDVEKNSKMYRSLGTIVGLVIIIILI